MRNKKGFTLIELMVALSIFIIVMAISLTSIISVYNANRKAHTLKSVMNNLNLAIESMSKEMRYGKKYHCGSGGTQTVPQNCPAGDNYMSFLASDGTQITYATSSSSLTKQIGAGTIQNITSPDIILDTVTFYAFGALNTDTLQPKVIMKVRGHSGTDKSRTDFTVETMASQRSPDI